MITHKRFEFTSFAYILIVLHSLVLIIGGHYTYAEVPLFDWIKDQFDLARNYYDKVGHFFQGFVPALIIRELFIRRKIVLNKNWLFFICVSICMFVSAFYELLEWWTAVILGETAESFLGTQGDIWDAQSDMFMALLGSMIAIIALGKYQDYRIKKLQNA